MNVNIQSILDVINNNSAISEDDKKSIATFLKEAEKTIVVIDFKLHRIEKERKTVSVLLEETIDELQKKSLVINESNAALKKSVEDLQATQALLETKNKDLEIEAALEKVRSSSLAMHTSDELHKVVNVVLERLQDVGIIMNNRSAIIVEFEKDSKEFIQWVASPEHASSFRFRTPHFDHVILKELWEAKESGVDFYTRSYTPEEKNSFFKYLFEHTGQLLPAHEQSWIFASEHYSLSVALEENTSIILANLSGELLSGKENEIVKRFAKVFEQAYVRFLDLQKAEAQAREATRQASLDRVRAQIASMRSTEDLQYIIPLIWNELKNLNIPFIRCGVFIIDELKNEVHIYLSSPEGRSLAAMALAFNSGKLITHTVEHWRKGMVYTEHWNKEEFVDWMQSMIHLGQVQNSETYQGTSQPPESLYLHLVPFTQGMLYVGNINPLAPEELDLVKSLAEAFSIAYARYDDFIKLEQAKQSIEVTLTELKATQKQLIQSEKMASLGELTAGIAHEIQNPLNFVNNFSEVSNELISEMVEELDKGDINEAKTIAEDVKQNLEKINHHGKRAGDIVKGMLQHSRSSSGVKELTDINKLADEYLRLAYHGLRAKDKTFNAKFETHFDEKIDKINIVAQDIGRVLLNLFNNGFYAVNEKKKLQAASYEPRVIVQTKHTHPTPGEGRGEVEIRVTDNGNGIPPNIIDKIFQPFFTTKPTGQGTGLGLSLSYDIIKAHGGEIKVETHQGQGSEFLISLPM
jgi:signal transduction histidine kinase